MTITEIYKKHKIMPNLQLHMLRVAAVAKYIADNATEHLDTNSIIKATLLHDMGNIIKFKLGYLPEALQPEGLGYWQGVKNEFVAKYGNDEHIATHKIAEELGLKSREMELLDAIGFAQSPQNSSHSDLEKKICAYSDYRVSPSGVTTLEVRLRDSQKRFLLNKNVTDQDRFEELSEGMRKIEKQIFTKSKIRHENITGNTVAPIVEELKNFEI